MRGIVAAALGTVAIAAGCLLLLLAISLVAANVDRGVYRERAAAAIQSGELAQRVWFPFHGNGHPGAIPPVYNHNDCAILSMLALDHRDGGLKPAMSPLLPITRAASRELRVPQHEACWRFVDVLEDPAAPAEYYHRYIHGHWVLGAALLPFMPFRTLSLLLMTAAVSIPLGTSLWAVRRLRLSGADLPRACAFAAMGAAGALLIAANNYGRSLSFAPSDIVIFGFLLFAFVRPLSSLSGSSFVWAMALFGTLTAIFEFLIGAIPAALAIFLGCLAFDPARDPHLLVRRAVEGVALFSLAVVAAFALKWLAVAIVWDWQEVRSALEKLAGWTTESQWSITLRAFPELYQLWSLGFQPEQVENSRVLTSLLALLRLANWSATMGFGSVTLGLLIILTGPVLLLLLGGVRLVIVRTAEERVRASLLLAGAVGMLAWHALFVHHSILHAYFMQRPFAWLTILFLGACAWHFGRWLDRRQKSNFG